MTWQHILGAALVSLPFIGVAALGIAELGWRETAAVFACVAAAILVIAVGSGLLTGALR